MSVRVDLERVVDRAPGLPKSCRSFARLRDPMTESNEFTDDSGTERGGLTQSSNLGTPFHCALTFFFLGSSQAVSIVAVAGQTSSAQVKPVASRKKAVSRSGRLRTLASRGGQRSVVARAGAQSDSVAASVRSAD